MRLHPCQWLLAAGLVAGSLKAYQSRLELQEWVRCHHFSVDGLEKALPSEVYFLETNRWLKFKIPKDTRLVRIISNASIRSSPSCDPANQWPYAIDYEFFTPQGLSKGKGVYHFEGEQLLFVDKATGRRVEVNSYLDRQMSPLSARQCVVNLQDPLLQDSQDLKLRLNARHPDLLNVGVRVYYEIRLPPRKLAYAWNRLSEDQQRDLARGNVYGFEGLSEREKLNVVAVRWAVAAPEGVPGRDFQSRTLYVRDDSENLREVKNWVPSGIFVDPRHCGALPITNVPGICQIEITDYAATSPLQVVSNTFIWHGQLEQRVETNSFTWSGTNQTFTLTNREGLLELWSSRAVYVRAFQVQNSLTNEITPEPVKVLAFTVSPTNILEYGIQHVQKAPTLFRIEVRRAPGPVGSAPLGQSVIRYVILDNLDQIWKSEEVTLTNAFSAYDCLVTTNGFADVTEPQSVCFALPPKVKTLRLVSPDELLFVNAYSRPSDLVKKVQVPEDYSAAKALAPDQPTWFTVRPPDHTERREAGQAVLLRVQPRIPEYDPLILAGQYEWDSLQPEADVRGNMVLLPQPAGQSLRPEHLPICYSPLRIGCAQKLRFAGAPWEEQVSPTLVLAFEHDNVGSARVVLDGQIVFDRLVGAPVSEVRLGRRSVGEHTISVDANTPVSAYLNYLQPATNSAALLQRFCLMASSNILAFPYVKQQAGAEVLVLRLFSPVAADSSTAFDVDIKLKGAPNRAVGPFDELTIFEREAHVRPDPVGASLLVSASSPLLDGGLPVFFPVGADLPPGQYTVEVNLASRSPRWLSLSRTTPGRAEKLALTLQHGSF